MKVSRRSQVIPWNDKIDRILLECIIEKGAHICKRGETDRTWNEVNDLFFDHPDINCYKDFCYEIGKYRKLQDHYKSLLLKLPTWQALKGRDVKIVELNNDEPNQFEIYKLLELIEFDIRKRDDELKNIDLIEKSNKTSDDSYAIENHHPHKKLKIKDQVLVFEDYKTNKNDEINNFERNYEVLMIQYINNGYEVIDSVIRDLNIDDNASGEIKAAISDLSIELLISVYCAPNLKFDKGNFRTDLLAMNVNIKTVLNLYRILEKIRENSSLM